MEEVPVSSRGAQRSSPLEASVQVFWWGPSHMVTVRVWQNTEVNEVRIVLSIVAGRVHWRETGRR